MISPANNDDEAPLIADAPARRPAGPRRRWAWRTLALLVLVPLGLTVLGVLTAPPRAVHVPQGRIVFLEADQPSEHTSLLRGLRITTAQGGGSRELLHEAEPQDVDAGSRDWLTQPTVSPNGHWLAYEKQLITLQEEKTGIVNQLWALPLDIPQAAPHLLADLTALHLKQPIGLAWTPDSKSVVFLEDSVEYTVSIQDAPRLTTNPLPGLPPLRPAPSLSATRRPAFAGPRALALEAQTAQGSLILVSSGDSRRRLLYPQPAPPLWAIMPGGSLAVAASSPGHTIRLEPAAGSQTPSADIAARWGWSVFGGRRITSLKWSPDGRYLGYTVSKPPFEDELFYADTQTGRCYQLPIRTGRAAWDWTR